MINLSGISSGASNQVQTLTVMAASSNPALIPSPAVNYTNPNTTGTLSFTPVAYASGTAIITVTVNNGQSQSNLVTRSFSVTVKAVNQPPTLDPLANLTLVKNAASQIVTLTGISSGAPNETQTLRVTAATSNSQVIPIPTVSYVSPKSTGSLSFRPRANVTGTSIITVTINDGGKSNNIITRQFTVTVLAQGVMPKILTPLTNQVAVAGQTTTFSVTASGTAPRPR